MIKEQLIIKTALENIFNPVFVHMICRLGYLKTGNKFSICFHGSKGYLDRVVVECEGLQKAENEISFTDIFTKKYGIRKKVINIYHSNSLGVRVSFGKDKPKDVPKDEIDEILKKTNNDLPF